VNFKSNFTSFLQKQRNTLILSAETAQILPNYNHMSRKFFNVLYLKELFSETGMLEKWKPGMMGGAIKT